MNFQDVKRFTALSDSDFSDLIKLLQSGSINLHEKRAEIRDEIIPAIRNIIKTNTSDDALYRSLRVFNVFSLYLKPTDRDYFGELLLQSLQSTNGNLRRMANSVMNNFRITFIRSGIDLDFYEDLSEEKQKTISQEQVLADENACVAFLDRLVKLKSKADDKKIASSLTSAFNRFKSPYLLDLLTSHERFDLVKEMYGYLPQRVKTDTVSLLSLVSSEDMRIPGLDSLYQHEDVYSDYLSALEESISDAYLDNRSLTDKDMIRELTALKSSLAVPISQLETEFQRDVALLFSEGLRKVPISAHELGLVFSYVLWAIDNRSYLGDPKGYLRWITFRLGRFSTLEEEKYKADFYKRTSRLGVSKKDADALLGLSDEFSKEVDDSDLEPRFYASTDKQQFLIEHFPKTEFLLEQYLEEDIPRPKNFFNTLLKEHSNYIPLYILFAEYFDERGELELAEKYRDMGLSQLEILKSSLLKEVYQTMKKALEDLM